MLISLLTYFDADNNNGNGHSNSATTWDNLVGGATLPGGYQQLLYIESTGTQYINTGIAYSASNSFKLNMNVEYTTVSPAHQIMGFTGHAGTGIGTEGSKWWEITNPASVTAGKIYNLEWYQSGANYYRLIEGVKTEGSIGNTQVTNNMYLFAAQTSNGNTTVNYYCHTKLYSANIYVNGNLVRSFIPCKNPSGTVVNGVFYGNNGTGTFIAGLPTGYQELEYIQSTGTQWIDTGVAVKSTLVSQLGFNMSANTGGVIFGNTAGGDATDSRLFNYEGNCYFDIPGEYRLIGAARVNARWDLF